MVLFLSSHSTLKLIASIKNKMLLEVDTMLNFFKKNTILILVILVAALSFTGVALAAEDDPAGQKPGRRRGHGEIISLGNMQFTVQTPDGTVATIQVSDRTRYRAAEGEVEGFDDLKVGQKVVVKTGFFGKNTARLVVVLPEDFQPRGRFEVRTRGEVAAVDLEAGSFQVLTAEDEELTFLVDEQTRFRGALDELADLEVGWQAGVAAQEQEDGSLLASFVLAGERQNPIRARGTVTAIDLLSDTFDLETAEGEQITVQVQEETVFKGQLETLAGLQVGWEAGIAAHESEEGEVIAKLVIAGERPERLRTRGEVTAVDLEAMSFTLKDPQGGESVYLVDEETRFQGNLSELADLQVGWAAGVDAVVQEDGTNRAILVIAGNPENFTRARGEITRVDAEAGTFTLLTEAGASLTCQVGEHTRYRGQLTSLEDMEVGWKAGVGARIQEDGSLMAILVVAGERPADPLSKNPHTP
jgi:hypothetical protein